MNLIENMNRFKQVSAALEIDVKYAYFIIPISMFLAAFRTLQSLFRDFRNGTLHYESRKD
jgi:TRAP-type C4-dicarboxylate transport system permease small subunit